MLKLKLKLQFFGHLMRRANSLENTLILEKIESRRKRGWQRMRWLDERVEWHHQLNGHEFEQTLGDGEGQGCLACCIPWGCKETQLSNWTTTTICCKIATLEWGQDKVVSVGWREPLFLHTKVPTHPFAKPSTTGLNPTRQEAHFCSSVQRACPILMCTKCKIFSWKAFLSLPLGLPSVVKNLPPNAGDMSSIPGSGGSPGVGNGNPLQYSCLGNPLGRGAGGL